jgi:hypothetical protein
MSEKEMNSAEDVRQRAEEIVAQMPEDLTDLFAGSGAKSAP